jgi:hypothetical protein
VGQELLMAGPRVWRITDYRYLWYHLETRLEDLIVVIRIQEKAPVYPVLLNHQGHERLDWQTRVEHRSMANSRLLI